MWILSRKRSLHLIVTYGAVDGITSSNQSDVRISKNALKRRRSAILNRLLSTHSRIYHWFGDVIIIGEELQILTFARHSWPMSRDGSYTRHIMVICENHQHSHPLPSVWQLSWHCLFLTNWVCTDWGTNPCLPHASPLPLCHRLGPSE